jgi:hypothetical protein
MPPNKSLVAAATPADRSGCLALWFVSLILRAPRFDFEGGQLSFFVRRRAAHVGSSLEGVSRRGAKAASNAGGLAFFVLEVYTACNPATSFRRATERWRQTGWGQMARQLNIKRVLTC